MSDQPESLDDLVRRADPDRWLSTRFIADERARADVLALYALNHELARVSSSVREPLMGEIRLTWWREAFEEIIAGKPPRKHPVVEAAAASDFRIEALEALPEGRFPELDSEPFDDDGVLAYLDGTAGAVMALAARRLDDDAHFEQVRGAARAFGLAGLWRGKQAGRKSRLPPDWTAADIRARVAAELTAARGELRTLPVAAFPAVAYAALARPYARGRQPGGLSKRLRLTLAVLRGRL
ncbi:MAG TPA: squalene/phytoene synthase family protein [Caulobacteraceae bacterium]|nr:squalene/phytoene synthase family protein [Caulobacteraceae bacterium]